MCMVGVYLLLVNFFLGITKFGQSDPGKFRSFLNFISLEDLLFVLIMSFVEIEWIYFSPLVLVPMKYRYEYNGVFPNSVTKISVITVKGLQHATSCARDQAATTVPTRHM